MMGKIIGLGAMIAVLCLTLVRAELKVTQVQVLFRHGDRTPDIKDLYPIDIHNVSAYEPWGLGQLINYQLWAYTTDVKRINGGPLVRRFIENMFLNRTKENPRKLYLFSAHERTLSAYLLAQGVTEPKIPLYGSAVMIEKLTDDDGEVYVRLVLWTGVTEQLITLRVPGCEEICPIETYRELTREIIPSDEEMHCHWNRLSAEDLQRVFDEKIHLN